MERLKISVDYGYVCLGMLQFENLFGINTIFFGRIAVGFSKIIIEIIMCDQDQYTADLRNDFYHSTMLI